MRHHAHHYLGFVRTQWDLFGKDHRVKPLLYLYRVLLTGIHLMNTGEVEANLVHLNEVFKSPHVAELIARKIEGPEDVTIDDADFDFHTREYERLTAALEAARDASNLPDESTARDALDDLLVRLRLKEGGFAQ